MGKKDISYQELEQGDIIFVSLNPTKGHEQRGERPCIVLTKKSSYLNYMYGVAPITTKVKKFPLHIPLPKDLITKGQILLEHHRMIDLETRGFSFVEKAPKELIEECSAKIKLLY
ncbi:type II toxin-antitoxin system PemK/MazF family toxin [Desemzia sp. FAM 23989]|uniref:type II toxin-antitoxin system PemK/MazF family toxin n=1 Tax=Desemzia sp. FAM 23989 TaxID=3259523 RepID=UPI0038875ECF